MKGKSSKQSANESWFNHLYQKRRESLIHFTDGCFRCGINSWRRSWQNRRGFFGKNVFDLFAFVVDPHQWNDDADNAQQLCCCKKFGWWRFGSWRFGWRVDNRWRGNWISMFCLRNDALCLDKSLFCASRAILVLSAVFLPASTRFGFFCFVAGVFEVTCSSTGCCGSAIYLLKKLYLIEQLPSNVN